MMSGAGGSVMSPGGALAEGIVAGMRKRTVGCDEVLLAVVCRVLKGEMDVGTPRTARSTTPPMAGKTVDASVEVTQFITQLIVSGRPLPRDPAALLQKVQSLLPPLASHADRASIVHNAKRVLRSITATPHGMHLFFTSLQSDASAEDFSPLSPVNVFCKKLAVHWSVFNFGEQDKLWMRMRAFVSEHASWMDESPPPTPAPRESSRALDENTRPEAPAAAAREPASAEKSAPPGRHPFAARHEAAPPGPAAAEEEPEEEEEEEEETAEDESFAPPDCSWVLNEAASGVVLRGNPVACLGETPRDAEYARATWAAEVERGVHSAGLLEAIKTDAARALDLGPVLFHYHIETGDRQRALAACLRHFDLAIARTQVECLGFGSFFFSSPATLHGQATAPHRSINAPAAAAALQNLSSAGAGYPTATVNPAAAAPGAAASGSVGKLHPMKTSCGWALLHLAYMHVQFDDTTSARQTVDEAICAGLSVSDKDMLATCGHFTVVLCLKEGRIEQAAEELVYAFRVSLGSAAQTQGQLFMLLAMLRLHYPVALSGFAEELDPFVPRPHQTESDEAVAARTAAFGSGGQIVGATLPSGDSTAVASALPTFPTEEKTDLWTSCCNPNAAWAWGVQGGVSAHPHAPVVAGTLGAIRAAYLQLPVPVDKDKLAATGLQLEESQAFSQWATPMLVLLRAQLLEQIGLPGMAGELMDAVAAPLLAEAKPAGEGLAAPEKHLLMQLALHHVTLRRDYGAAAGLISFVLARTPGLSRQVPLQHLILLAGAHVALYLFNDNEQALAYVDQALQLIASNGAAIASAANKQGACFTGYAVTPDAPVLIIPHLKELRVKCLRDMTEALRYASQCLDEARMMNSTRWIARFSILVAEVETKSESHHMAHGHLTNAIRLADMVVLPAERAEACMLLAAGHVGDDEPEKAWSVLATVWRDLVLHLTATGLARLHLLTAQVLAVGFASDGPGFCGGRLFPTHFHRWVAVPSPADLFLIAFQHIQAALECPAASAAEKADMTALLAEVYDLVVVHDIDLSGPLGGAVDPRALRQRAAEEALRCLAAAAAPAGPPAFPESPSDVAAFLRDFFADRVD
ncbi:hypothetical protein DIPPA_08331 [Diplonema papillatum]|nr:hypothetical protein DIPPA_08331 [Diplonema papillatum]